VPCPDHEHCHVRTTGLCASVCARVHGSECLRKIACVSPTRSSPLNRKDSPASILQLHDGIAWRLSDSCSGLMDRNAELIRRNARRSNITVCCGSKCGYLATDP
jgi:hypothetical protein